MTLEVLEDTILDLGPGFWAFAILIALLAIEVFQLGPHSLSSSPTPKKNEDNIKDKNIRLDRAGFRKLIVTNDYFGKRSALLVVGTGRGGFALLPKSPPKGLVNRARFDDLVSAQGGTAEDKQPGCESGEGGGKETLFPPSSDFDNYVVCIGSDDPVAKVVRQLLPLWAARDRMGAKYIVLYSHRVPSTYAVQQVAATLKGYTKRVNVFVLYSENDESEGDLKDKVDHLGKYNIQLEKI